MTSVADLLQGGSSFEFDTPGQEVEGTVVKSETQHQTKLGGSGELLYWDDAKTRPKLLIFVVLQTDLRTKPDDTGLRNVFFSGHKFTALQQSGAKDLNPGDYLKIKFTAFSERDPAVKGHNRAKLYEVTYRAGNGVAATLNGGSPPASPPAAAPASTPAAAYGPRPAFIPEAAWNFMSDSDKAQASPPVAAATFGPRPNYIPEPAWGVMTDAQKAMASPPPAY